MGMKCHLQDKQCNDMEALVENAEVWQQAQSTPPHPQALDSYCKNQYVNTHTPVSTFSKWFVKGLFRKCPASRHPTSGTAHCSSSGLAGLHLKKKKEIKYWLLLAARLYRWTTTLSRNWLICLWNTTWSRLAPEMTSHRPSHSTWCSRPPSDLEVTCQGESRQLLNVKIAENTASLKSSYTTARFSILIG